MKKQINIRASDDNTSAENFIHAWKKAESGKHVDAEYKLTFENLEVLLKTLTTARWELLKTLRKGGPMSVRSLAKELGRDYKNVHTDVGILENVGLIQRAEDNRIVVPWDIVEANLHLAA